LHRLKCLTWARLVVPQASEEERLRKLSTSMTAGDAIKRMLLASRDRDYFRCVAPGAGCLFGSQGMQHS
jgi:hypothetical protein